jgi:tetratricopeptide (TPR) repeat protein
VGKNDVAVDLIIKALAIKPDFAEAHNNLGNALQELGKLDEAVASYHKALAIKPNYSKAHNNLGIALQDLGKLDEAVASYHKALAIKPDFPEAHNNLGNALKDLWKLDEAVASYRKALALNPDYAKAHYNLGIALQDLGRQEEAFACRRRAVSLDPQNDLFWAGLASSLETLSFASLDDNLYQDLLHLLERPTVRPSNIIQPIISALRHHPDFSRIVELTGSGKLEIGFNYGDVAGQLSAIPLFLRILELSPIYDLEIERMLTFLRHAMIEEATASKMKEKCLPFSVALALQCFTNEYVFFETEEEKEAVEKLEQRIALLTKKGHPVPPSFVVALGTYRPLFSFPWAQKLSERKWTDSIKSVFKRQISEPLEERSLRDQIPCVTSIQNSISKSVREQYEENPYPRWIKSDLAYKSRALASVLRESPLRFDLGDYVSPESPEILVAGCGTGQHVLTTASRFSSARVLAVDLSLNSLSYALRKTNELGFSDIEYAQADIMELGGLGRQFDLIECVGVLHHLGDPLTGWGGLVDLLRPGGLMMVGLYSKIARQHIILGRSLIAENGYSSSPEDIRRCRQDIIAMAEDGNTTMAKICNGRDFFNLSECRDLLFHVQEHRFTLPQIEEALKDLNLKFLGFEMRNQSTLSRFKESHPNNNALTSLSLWHDFELENPDTFIGMYQFWCKKL